MNEYIYLRVSHSDDELVEKLTKELEAAGHKVWLAQGAEGGGQQLRQTQFAIERSDAFLLGLSPEFLAEAGVEQELKLAKAAEKPIFVVQLRPAERPTEWEAVLADRLLVDLSDDFEAGLATLLFALRGPEKTMEVTPRQGNFFGGDYFGRVPALPGEQIVWSEGGLYWFSKWRTLVRALITLTDQRLIFFWDSRDIWKWKPREANELEESFPVTVPLDEIRTVGEVNKPKTFLIFATGRPSVEIMAAGGELHRFSLETDFEARIDALRDAVTTHRPAAYG